MECSCCMQLLALIATALVLTFVWFMLLPLSYWRRKGIPSAPAVPLLGSIADSFLQKIAIADDYKRIYYLGEGYRYVGFQKLLRPSIMVRDPELLKDVLVKDFSSFHDNDIYVTPESEPMMGRSIFFMHGDLWKRTRSSLTPAFSSGRIKSMMPLLQDVCDDLMAYLAEWGEGEQELKELFARFTTNVVASCAFGLKTDCLRRTDEEFRKMGSKMVAPSPIRGLAQLLVLNMPTMARFLRIKFIPNDVADFFRQVVRDVVQARDKSGESRKDFLNIMLLLKKAGKLGVKAEKEGQKGAEEALTEDSGGKEMNYAKIVADPESLDDVTAQAVGFFLDGFETSSSVISFTLFELAHNPEIQEKLRKEIEIVLTSHGGKISYDALQEMHYLEMVIQESLRKYPPVPFLLRMCTKRYRLPPPKETVPKDAEGIWIEAGTPVLVPVHSLHHDPRCYPEPEVFDPERFSKERRHEVRGLCYLPFGDGPRICIGNRFGLAQVKAAIASLLPIFELKPCSEKSPMPIELDPQSVLLFSKRNLWVKFEKIQRK